MGNTIFINQKATLWLLAIFGAFTLLNFKLALFWSGKPCRESANLLNKTDRYSPLIFIGGIPRSGTTLIRAMLDSHPDVRCGQETRIIPRMVAYHQHMLDSKEEHANLALAGVTEDVMQKAFAKFYLEIIANHDYLAPRLCNKDPLLFLDGNYMYQLFPNAKFLFMIRDGRAVVHSIISRNISYGGMDETDYRKDILKWNESITVMDDECRKIGRENCMRVYYEQLVLKPEKSLRTILDFLDLPWNEAVLHHEQFINKPNGVHLSKSEHSTDQVIHPIYLDSLSSWVGQIPDDVIREMHKLAPMLSLLGYDPFANPPDYSNLKLIDV